MRKYRGKKAHEIEGRAGRTPSGDLLVRMRCGLVLNMGTSKTRTYTVAPAFQAQPPCTRCARSRPSKP